jgi:prepilin-type processing-associated H-X9-DG protein
MGSGFTAAPTRPDGLFERTPALELRFRDVKDGTSNVIAVGERSPSFSPWAAWASANGVWIDADHGINRMFIAYGSVPPLVESGANGNYGASSWHSGGVQFLFADGSVQFISENINQSVYRDLSQFADGQPTGGFTP